MSKLVWDQTGQKTYETGVEQCALYPQAVDGAYPKGVAWNGISNISENPSGAEPTAIYADNRKYLNLMSAEEYGATIEAYTYPDEFAECDGSKEIAPGVFAGQQDRKTFGVVYKTLIGNDISGTNYGYKLHIIYGALAAPSEKGHSTVNENQEAMTFSWELSTTPVTIEKLFDGKKLKPTASITVDSTKTNVAKLSALEAILYGSDSVEARLPLPDEIIDIVGVDAVG